MQSIKPATLRLALQCRLRRTPRSTNQPTEARSQRLDLLFAAVLALGACGGAPTPETEVQYLNNTDWSVYLGDSGRQHYSPLAQIDRDNVNDLEVAWTYTSAPDGEGRVMYTSPLVIDGVLYGLSPNLVPFALDAATGVELWRRDDLAHSGTQRGLMWWQRDEDRRVFYASGIELIALDARTGKLVSDFADGGRLDMTPSDTGSSLRITVPGVVFEDLLIMGFSTSEDSNAYPGAIRAYSAIDGKLIWKFRTIPEPGEIGADTWAPGSLARAGGANVWTGMALDEQRGMLYAPTGSATPDFYGADRLGDNLFANSLVALDARTGAYRWHHQVVRHDLWDKDNPSPPTLVSFERGGERVEAVTLATKTGHLFAFDRDTGEPLYPLVEIDTPIPSTLPREVPSPKQYLSSVEISNQEFRVTDRTPEATAYVSELIKDWDLRPWAPPKVGTVLFYPWYDGGAEWGGSAYDPNTDRLILNTNDAAAILTLAEVPVGFSAYGTYLAHCAACHGADRTGTERGVSLSGVRDKLGYAGIMRAIEEGAAGMPAFAHLSEVEKRALYYYLSPAELPEPDPPREAASYALTSGYVYLRDHEGLPGNAPPWGTLNAFDLATGNLVWKVNFGNFLSHPELDYGAINYGGPVVTASGLIFIGATPDKRFRAYDSDTGAVLWQTELPAGGFATPAIYSVDGTQYVVIAAGGGRLGPPSASEYIAFKLGSRG
ncbi:MAG: PQQ-binding-like beta-propeller repeat protein [Pseudomonadota bacterium]